EFLQYVFDRAVQQPDIEVHEQEIGHRVFGRSPDYDTAADNVVRVTASQARKKLEQYFASDGAAEPVILYIPKGKYTPLFRERAAAAVPEARDPATDAERRLATYRRAALVLAGCTLALAVAALWLAAGWRNAQTAARSEMERSPGLAALWSQLLPPSGRTDIVISDSSLSLYEELLDRPLSLAEYVNAN